MTKQGAPNDLERISTMQEEAFRLITKMTDEQILLVLEGVRPYADEQKR